MNDDDEQRARGAVRVPDAVVALCVLLPALFLAGWFAWQWLAPGDAAGSGVTATAAASGAPGLPREGHSGLHAAHASEDAYYALEPGMREAVAARMAPQAQADAGEVDLGERGTMTRLPPAHHPVTVGRVVNGQVVVGEVMQLPEGAAGAATNPGDGTPTSR